MNRQQRRAAERNGGGALPVAPEPPDPALVQAVQLHRAGRLAEADQLCRQIVALKPRAADALHLQGVIALQQERPEAALELIKQALAIDARQPHHHNNLGSALRALGRSREAIASYRRALAIRPQYPRALVNLGRMLAEDGQNAEAADCLRRAMALTPLDLEPVWALASLEQSRGALGEAALLYERALTIAPGQAEILENLIKLRYAQDRPDELIEALRRALAIRPDKADYWQTLAVALTQRPDLEGALHAYGEVIRSDPDSAAAHNGMANVLADLGRLDEAIGAYHQAVRLAPEHHEAHSNLIMTLHAAPNLSAADILAESRRFAQSVESGPEPAFANDRDPERRLRIGYVSADFRIHPVGFFLERVLAAHDPRQVEAVLYSDTVAPDELTERLIASSALWKPILGVSHEDVAAIIRADEVDVLIDLAGHTGHNRLPVFGARAAPVQASWLGYFGSTGLSRMDYVIADERVIPAGEDALYSEQVVRLPTPYLCWAPPHEAVPIAPPPALENGFVTFGVFNNSRKITPAAIDAWAQILKRTPGSRLFMKYWTFADETCRNSFIDAFARLGVASERLEFEGITPRLDALAAYNRIDIALDPFPFSGCTTTADTLWMGVPTLALAGERWAGRMSGMILSCVGLDDWAAADLPAYVETAVRKAGDVEGLATLRAELRGRMERSAFCEGPRLARHLEAAWREMWRAWCAKDQDS